MRGSYDYRRKQQHGWDTTSHDYHAHLSKMERTTSVLNGVPHYPTVHKVFNNNVVIQEEEEHGTQQQQQQHGPEVEKKVKKKVQVIEGKQTTEHGKNGNCEDVEETDGFIQQKRKGFELCKWATFKAS